MKNKSYSFSSIWFAFAAILLVACMGCGGDVEHVNFILNGRDIEATNSEPIDPADSLKMLTVFVGDTIYIQDKSAPEKYVKSRAWDIDGDGIADDMVKDVEFFPIFFDQPGMTKITLMINGETTGVSKWIKIEDMDFSASLQPNIAFHNPFNGEVFNKRSINIQASVENVTDKSEINFLVNDKSAKFKFDEESNLLTAKVRLKKGSNTLQIEAENFDGSNSEIVLVDYEREIPKTPPIPKKSTGPKVVILNKTIRPLTTRQKEVQILTDNYTGRDLDIKLNGVTQNEYEYSKSKGYWTVQLDLNEGRNNLAVSIANGRGVDNTTYVVDTAPKTKQEERDLIVETPPKPKKILSSFCSAGIPLAQHNGFNGDCIALYTKDKYTIQLQPKQRLELQSFYVYANDCGGLKVTLSGDGYSENFSTALTAGKTQVLFNNIYAELQAGIAYTLTLQTISGYRGCNASAAPRLEKVTDCNVSQKSCNALQLSQNSNPILYDLKLLY